jgi:hypothetical protein
MRIAISHSHDSLQRVEGVHLAVTAQVRSHDGRNEVLVKKVDGLWSRKTLDDFTLAFLHTGVQTSGEVIHYGPLLCGDSSTGALTHDRRMYGRNAK